MLADADVRLEIGELNSKLTGFLKSSGQRYQRPYTEIKSNLKEEITENRVETWKKLFQELGLLWVDDGILQRTRFGELISDSYADSQTMVERERLKIAAAAARVLGSQQLLNPTTKNRDYPEDCDVLPYRAIWHAISRLGELHWEEVHRVMLRTMRDEDIELAIEKIEAARSHGDYNPQDEASATKYLGPPVYPDPGQAARRITPWFSAAGFGGLLIEREPTNGTRSFTALGALLIPEELQENRKWFDFGDDQRAWFAHLNDLVSVVSVNSEDAPEISNSSLSDDDPVYLEVQKLLTIDQASGLMFVGPPGTGKSWYARQIALKMTNGDTSRVCEVQFHPSYQYEDFVEGYAPDGVGGFSLVDKHLLKMISVAASTDAPVVIVIDEFSRSDPARTLGEALTYMETSLRGVPFYLMSGRKTAIPENLVFFATMNPNDRSVDELDAAMERRWAKVSMTPDKDVLKFFLTENGAESHVIGATAEFFIGIQSHLEIGHALFRTVRDKESLLRLWETQLKYLVRKQLRFKPDALEEAEGLWAACVQRITSHETASQPLSASAEVAAE